MQFFQQVKLKLWKLCIQYFKTVESEKLIYVNHISPSFLSFTCILVRVKNLTRNLYVHLIVNRIKQNLKVKTIEKLTQMPFEEKLEKLYLTVDTSIILQEVHISRWSNTPRIRAGSVAYFSFQYLASVKPYRFRDTESRNCVLAYPQSNRPTNRK